MMLLSNEEELVSSNGGRIVLTNQRIHMADREWGRSYAITIFLEDISSVEMRYTSHVVLLILAIVAAFGCAIMLANNNGGGGARVCILATIVYFLLYWFTRKHIVSITSKGGKALIFEANSLPEYEMMKFLARLQEAKLQRVGALKNQASI